MTTRWDQLLADEPLCPGIDEHRHCNDDECFLADQVEPFIDLMGSPLPAPAEPDDRDVACVEAWPESHTGGYDPRCCRFPKSCSASITDPAPPAEVGKQPASAAWDDPCNCGIGGAQGHERWCRTRRGTAEEGPRG